VKSRLKFKIIFVIFYAIILAFFVFVFVVPVFVLGREFSVVFWRSAWPLALLLFLILLGMDVFYWSNHRLLYLLEREDWPALVQYLEDRIYRKGEYTSRKVQLLANTYLVLSDSRSVMALESKVAVAKPRLVDANLLLFGAARILGRDYAGAVRFFAEHQVSPSEKKGHLPADHPTSAWAAWYYGFALLLNTQYALAAEAFMETAKTSEDGALTALAACFLAEPLHRALPNRGLELMTAALDGRNRVLGALPDRAAWDKEIARVKSEVYTMVLSKYIDEAAQWMYSKENLAS
jgi:hypothetical protein